MTTDLGCNDYKFRVNMKVQDITKNKVTKSNKIVEAHYKLTLLEMKLLLIVISQIQHQYNLSHHSTLQQTTIEHPGHRLAHE